MAEQLIRWVTRVPPDHLKGLRKALDTIDANPGGNALLPFAGLPMLHFTNVTLFDEGDNASDPILVFESNIDAPFSNYADALVRIGRKGLDAIYSGCGKYPAPTAGDHEVVSYLAGLTKKPNLYHIGHPNRSVQAIKGDFELRRSIAHELATHPSLKQLPPAELIREIRHQAGCPSTLWASLRAWHPSWQNQQVNPPTPLREIQWVPESRSGLRLRFVLLFGLLAWLLGTSLVIAMQFFGVPRFMAMFFLAFVMFALVAKASADAKLLKGATVAAILALLVTLTFRLVPLLADPPGRVVILALVILAPVAFLVLFSLNMITTLPLTQPFAPLNPHEEARVQKLVEAEDLPKHRGYNHVAGLSVLMDRHRLVRRARTWLALFVLNLFYRTMYVHGKLATIPTIHFAQWSLVDDHHVLFVTNYDGGADSYLDDFFNSLARGVAFIWIDTTIFPGTMDPRHLKEWVRKGQTLARVRYLAAVYDGLTVGAINSNTYIRKRLLHGWSDASARRWLRRFATIPEEPSLFTRLSYWLKARAGDAS